MKSFHISRADSDTICKEIGERLQDSFLAGPLSASMRLLIWELAKADTATNIKLG
jgi:hypothetical protein